MGFDFMFKYRASKDNLVADAISRKYEDVGLLLIGVLCQESDCGLEKRI